MSQEYIPFPEWYKQRHGYSPFPWQIKLAESVKNGTPPPSCILPTAVGKTTVIAVWVWATELGLNVPTRLIYVIDRRLLVDSISDYADELCRTNAIMVHRLKGGDNQNSKTETSAWLMAPDKPTIIVCTVDQLGSRILFRGYGVTTKTAPIHAALVGNDVYIVLDEAHISSPFLHTLYEIKERRFTETTLFWLTAMTATPAMGQDLNNALRLTNEDTKNPLLNKRLCAQKLAKLIKVSERDFIKTMVSEAKDLRTSGAQVVGIICNTTRDARLVFKQLDEEKKVLLTGRVREKERSEILAQAISIISVGSRTTETREPIFVVATQTIEIGADLDFDAIVTQSAPIDSLRQRFGRQDRLGELGETFSVIVHKDLLPEHECYVYGKQLLKKTWSWLTKSQTGKGRNKAVDFGVLAIQHAITNNPPPMREVSSPLPLSDDILRQLRQTLPRIEVDIHPFLHGEKENQATVSIIWREDLTEDNKADWVKIVQAVPPVIAESMPCSLNDCKQWLKGREVIANNQRIQATHIRPGAQIVVPCSYGGYSQWGWDPDSIDTVSDIGNEYTNKKRLIGIYNTSEADELISKYGIDSPIFESYPAGLIVRNKYKNSQRQNSIDLDEHQANVANVANRLSHGDPDIIAAALHHDDGKADPRCQILFGATSLDAPIAKPAHQEPSIRKQAKRFCGLPKGWRHELKSAAEQSEDISNLRRYLIATHHGYARTILPISGDLEQWEKLQGMHWAEMTKQLNEQHGIWGLAYKEALVRLADWEQSRREQEIGDA